MCSPAIRWKQGIKHGCEAEKGQLDYYTDWDEIYVEKHKDMNELEYRHLYVARNIEEVLEKGADV